MKKFKVNQKLIAMVLLAIIFIISLCIRIIPPAERVFSDVGIRYGGADVYYNMRQVDSLAHNFPNHTEIDPYLIYPGAPSQVQPRFFAWLMATLSWIFGLGSPTQHIIDLVGIYTPAILGALVVVPVYIIGKELFGRWAGILSALLIAIIPGEFLGRSILSFTDYHIAESLFTATAIMFLIMAMKRASQRQVTFGHVKKLDWPVIKKPLVYSMLGGLFLGLYIFTWAGSLLFIFIIFLGVVIQFIIDHFRKKSTDYLCIVGVPFFLVALIIALLVSSSSLYIASLIVALIASAVLSGVSWFFSNKTIKPFFYPLTMLGLGLAGLGLFYLVSPGLVSAMLRSFANFIPQGAHITTIEMQPLISPNYSLQYGSMFSLVWGNYPGLIPLESNPATVTFQNILGFMTTSFFYSIVSLCLLIYVVIKRGESGKALLVVWSLVILVCNLIQRRFGYYYAVNVALLVGYLSWMVFERVGFKDTGEESEEAAVKKTAAIKSRLRKKDSSADIRRAIMGFTAVIVIVVVYPWNIETTIGTAKAVQYAPSEAWVSSLEWMKTNTPEPFGSPDAYYDIFEIPPQGEEFQYPESAYGVLSWWDYGYWITRIGHRIPTANPSQDSTAITNVAVFFTSKDEASANEIINEVDARYIVIDSATNYDKFHAVVLWAGESLSEYYEYFVWQEGEEWVYKPRFYPKYYKSLVTRLYGFNGEAVIPESVTVIAFQDITISDNVYKQITGEAEFATYEEAEAYVSSQESPNFRIASKSPLTSVVSLDKLEHYRLAYGSGDLINVSGQATVSAVKIFEYIE